jgi:phosphomannomutase
VTDLPRDKDGITAAVIFAELVAAIRADGGTVEGRLDELAANSGATSSRSAAVRLDPAAAGQTAAIEATPPEALGSRCEQVVTPVAAWCASCSTAGPGFSRCARAVPRRR